VIHARAVRRWPVAATTVGVFITVGLFIAVIGVTLSVTLLDGGPRVAAAGGSAGGGLYMEWFGCLLQRRFRRQHGIGPAK
jgi:hypothetical protein